MQDNKKFTAWKVLPAVEEDLADILTIEKSSFDGPWSENIFLKELYNPVSNFFVAKGNIGGQEVVLAYIVFWVVHGEAHLLNLSTHPDYRRIGVAARLLSFSIQFMAESGVEDIYLEVRRSNEAAIELYESFKFRHSYVRKKYYGDEDAMIMELKVDGWENPYKKWR